LRSQYFDYTNANCPAQIANNAVNNSPNGYYSITITSAKQTYNLKAVPIAAPQTADKSCVEFDLDQTGKQSAKDSANNNTPQTAQTCWASS